MKICFYGNLSKTLLGSPIGGGELQLVYLAKELSYIGHLVYIVDFQCDEDFEYNKNLKVISFKKYIENKSRLLKYFYLYKILKEINADVYHCRIRGWMHIIPYLVSHKNGKYFSISLASNTDVCTFNVRFKNFYKHRGLFYFLRQGLLTEVIFPYLLKNANIVFAQNNFQKDKLETLKINNCLLRNIYSTGKKLLNAKSEQKKYFAYVGSLSKRKGFDIFWRLAETRKNILFKVVGDFRNNDGIKSNTLENVEFLGRLSHSDTLSVISSAKALISTSRMEGFPNVFLEAWANGVPVISFAFDPDDLIKKNDLGYFCENNFGTLENVIQNFNEITFESNVLIDYVNKNHDSKIIAHKFISCLQIKKSNQC